MKDSGRLPALAAWAGISAAGIVVAFLGGRWGAPEAGNPLPPPAEEGSDKVPARPVEEHRGPRASRGYGPEAPAPRSPQEPAGDPSRGETGEPAPRPLDLEPALLAARRAAAEPEDERALEVVHRAAAEWTERVLDDPEALASTLARFDTTRDAAELGFLAAVLGRVADPEVEEAAVRIARGDAHPSRRAAAFDVLDALDTPAAIDAALETLAREPDAAVRLAALRSIPDPTGASWDEAAPVADRLGEILAHDSDAEARRRAAVLLARWHRGDDEFRPVLEALSHDPDPAVRAGAAYACEVAGRRDESVTAALVQALRSPSEDNLVRENAWRALGSLGPLPPEAHEAYEAFRAAREGEGGSDDG
ncbi:MAG: HEAT repeat domain-containing protein [Planctomycetes bacterium]|nr:HEAT repeat domain-containing protein [Planctomycetota bacterium]